MSAIADPMVSVCMITYNHEKYISQAIEGVLMQKADFSIELVIGEDCSTDNTRTICEHYANHHSDIIRLLPKEKNMGMIPNLIRTFQACRGKYLAFCEGDDYWINANKLHIEVDFLEGNPDYGLVYTDVDRKFETYQKYQKSIFGNKYKERSLNFEEHLINKSYLAPLTWVFRRELLPSLNESYSDGTFALMLDFFKITKIHYMDIVTGVYRASVGSASKLPKGRGSYCYEKGVFRIQQKYIEKYKVTKDISFQIEYENYLKLFEIAIEYNDYSFINEASKFFIDNNLVSEAIVAMVQKKSREIRRLNSLKIVRIARSISTAIHWFKRQIS